MDIEENDFYDSIILAGKKIKHVHITESHRGMLGEVIVNWNELFKAFKAIDFEGNLVLENFSSSISGMQQAVSLWQKSPYEAEDLAKKSLEFLRKQI